MLKPNQVRPALTSRAQLSRSYPVRFSSAAGIFATASARDRPLPSVGAPGAADGSAPVDAEAPTDEAAAGGFESSVFAALGLHAASEVTRKTAVMGAMLANCHSGAPGVGADAVS